MDLSQKTLLILPLDTAAIVLDPGDDVVDGLPLNGPTLPPRMLLSSRFRERLTGSLRWHLNRSGLRVEMADSLVNSLKPQDTVAVKGVVLVMDSTAGMDSTAIKDTAVTVAAAVPRPDFTLKIKSLESRRISTTELMPKIGTIVRRPLYFSGEFLLWDVARGAAVTTDRFRVHVTGSRGIQPDDWQKAFDEAARQIAKAMPIGKKKR